MEPNEARKRLSEAVGARQKAEEDWAQADARIAEIVRENLPGRTGSRKGLTTKEAAEIVGVTKQGLYELLKRHS